jgi:antitoxin PrlF
MARIETYPAAPARIGNSRGYRIDAALFQAHPELQEGDFEVAYLGAGTLLVRPRTEASGSEGHAREDTDPVMAAYLAWTERTMTQQPDLLRPLSQDEFALAEKLVAGLEVDLEHDRLPDDFVLP